MQEQVSDQMMIDKKPQKKELKKKRITDTFSCLWVERKYLSYHLLAAFVLKGG